VTSELEKENSELRASQLAMRGRLDGYATDLAQRDAVEIQQYSLAEPDEVDFPSPTSTTSTTSVTEPFHAPKAAEPRRRVRFEDEAPGTEGGPAGPAGEAAETDRFYEWLMVDDYVDQKAGGAHPAGTSDR